MLADCDVRDLENCAKYSQFTLCKSDCWMKLNRSKMANYRTILFFILSFSWLDCCQAFKIIVMNKGNENVQQRKTFATAELTFHVEKNVEVSTMTWARVRKLKTFKDSATAAAVKLQGDSYGLWNWRVTTCLRWWFRFWTCECENRFRDLQKMANLRVCWKLHHVRS